MPVKDQSYRRGIFIFHSPFTSFLPGPWVHLPRVLFFFFPLKPRGSLWKQQRGRFPICRMMRIYIYSGWFMPKFTAHFGAGVDFELLRCYQQEARPQKVSTASERAFTLPRCLSWAAFPLVPVDAGVQPFSPSGGWSHQLLLHPGAGPAKCASYK